MTSLFYNKSLIICEKYFKNSGKDFLDRMIKSHLHKDKDTIGENDKDELVKWCRISASLLLGNEKANDFSKEISAIS